MSFILLVTIVIEAIQLFKFGIPNSDHSNTGMPLGDSNHDFHDMHPRRPPIWAHVVPITTTATVSMEEGGTFISNSETLTSYARAYLEKVYVQFHQSDMFQSSSRSMVAGVMNKRFGELDPKGRSSQRSNIRDASERCLTVFEESLELQSTADGILVNLSHLARCSTLLSDDFDVEKRRDSYTRRFSLRDDEVNLSWFQEPLWAWTSEQRIFFEAIDIVDRLKLALPMKVHVSLSNLDDCGVQITFPWKQSSREYLRVLYCLPSHTEFVHSDQGLSRGMNEMNHGLGLQQTRILAGERPSETTVDICVDTVPVVSPTQCSDESQREVTLEPSQLIHQDSEHTDPEYSAKALHIDSDGIDMTVLSQLPPKLRSEVRLTMVVAAREKKRRAPDPGKIWHWLVESKTGSSVTPSAFNSERSRNSTLLESRRRKRARTIGEYFKK